MPVDFEPLESKTSGIDFEPTGSQIDFQPETTSVTPETDKAVAQTATQAVLSRAKSFVEGAGIPTSVEGLKEAGKWLIRSPVQDVKEISQDISKLPERISHFGQTLSESPAAKVVRDPLSPESFGTYGTIAGMAGPKVLEPVIGKIKGGELNASKIRTAEEVPMRDQGQEMGGKAPLRQQGEVAQAEAPGEAPLPETVLEPTGVTETLAELKRRNVVTPGEVALPVQEGLQTPTESIKPKGGEINETPQTSKINIQDEGQNRGEASQAGELQGVRGQEPPPVQSELLKETGEQSPPAPTDFGISQARTESELGQGSVEPGAGAEMGSGLAYGRDYINKGGDPRLPIRRAQSSGLVGKNEVGIVHAELERLRGLRDEAAKAVETNPNDPVAQAALDTADNAQRAWRKELQPVLTKSSDALREAYAESSVPDVGSFQGLMNLVDEHFKGQRELTPADRTTLQKVSKTVSVAREETAQAVNRVAEVTAKTIKRRVMNPEELKSDLAGVLADAFKDCVL